MFTMQWNWKTEPCTHNFSGEEEEVKAMASIAEVVEGLEILAKTASVPLGLAEKGENDRRTAHLGGADHDVIWGPDADPSDEDKTRLEQLGWHFDEELDCWSRFV